MNNYQNPPRRQQQRGVSWIRWLIPLALLLIFVYSPSWASFFVSVAIIVLIWGLIAAASARARQWTLPPVQQLPLQQPPVSSSQPPELETPYEQGYRGVVMTPQPAPSAQGAEEERLAQLKLIGDLHQAGILSEEEFQRQKEHVLRADAIASGATKEAAEPETASPEAQYEEQPEAQYEQELPPIEQQ
jgi:hypothetical protein